MATHTHSAHAGKIKKKTHTHTNATTLNIIIINESHITVVETQWQLANCVIINIFTPNLLTAYTILGNDASPIDTDRHAYVAKGKQRQKVVTPSSSYG